MQTINLHVFRISVLSLLLAFSVMAGTETARGAPPKKDGTRDAAGPMTNARLDALIRRIDKNTKGQPGVWEFMVEGRKLLVITDEKADRMRIMTPVAATDTLDEPTLYRLMQANFDTALDARYAIARETVWSVFLHPLQLLSVKEFLVGLGQVVNLAETYGSSYSSGLLVFRGGDSSEMQRRGVIDRLLKHGIEL